MSIELTCLGGAAAWPNPGQGCSSYLIRSGETSILVDAGPDTLHELRKHIDVRTVDAVLISHCHSDHILDLVPYRYGLVYGPIQASERIPLYLPPGGRPILDALGQALGGHGEKPGAFWDDVFLVREYDPAAGLGVGSLSVSFARTVHAATCYAMRFDSADGSSLTYTADTGTIESVLTLASGSSMLIAEGTMPEDEERPGHETGHLKPSEAGVLAAQAGVRYLVMTHLWIERPDGEVISAARRAFNGEILIAKPGLVVYA